MKSRIPGHGVSQKQRRGGHMMKSHENTRGPQARQRTLQPHKHVEQNTSPSMIRGTNFQILILSLCDIGCPWQRDVSKQAFLEPLITMDKRHLTPPSPHLIPIPFFSLPQSWIFSQRVCQHISTLHSPEEIPSSARPFVLGHGQPGEKEATTSI